MIHNRFMIAALIVSMYSSYAADDQTTAPDGFDSPELPDLESPPFAPNDPPAEVPPIEIDEPVTHISPSVITPIFGISGVSQSKLMPPAGHTNEEPKRPENSISKFNE